KFIFMMVLKVLSLGASGQNVTVASNPISLEITFNKTSTILFPSMIVNVDRGSRDLLAQKARSLDNILQLKAAKKQPFLETNLTVVTADGKLYHFIVNYAENPKHLTLKVINQTDKSPSTSAPVILESDLNQTVAEHCAQTIINAKHWIGLNRQNKYKIRMALEGIYIKDNTIFYHIKVSNKSNIRYDIDILRFYIKDKENLKRTATQEIPVKPLYVYNEGQSAIEGNSTIHFVYVLEKFTIPDAKLLMIEMFEKNGGRHLNLRVKNNAIVNARPVPHN
ncbi:MAG TPA: conjugative transposon protein TraN, partial [Ohtaekwangia sp.]|nr:conjugative transposon protein TraN [Ohtaekwangia sp.]